jgi:hypothetical protein
MNHGELVKAVFVVHGPVLFAGLAALYRYGDRTEIIKRSLEGSDALLKRMRALLADGFKKSLKPWMQSAPSPIILPSGNSYSETPLNVARSDAYIERIDDFVYEHTALLADYRLALGTRASWCFWAKCLSWLSLALVVWEVVLLGAVGMLDVMCDCPISDKLLLWACIPTAGIVAAGLLALALCLRRHDTLSDLRMRYDGP